MRDENKKEKKISKSLEVVQVGGKWVVSGRRVKSEHRSEVRRNTGVGFKALSWGRFGQG